MNNAFAWYQQLNKPSFAPPSWLFGRVWSILYPIIFASFAFVFYKYIKKEISFIVILPFIINAVSNLLFTPIQFGLRNNSLAALDITIVVVSLVWAIIAIFPYSKIIAIAQIPYLIWGSYALILQYSITYLNK